MIAATCLLSYRSITERLSSVLISLRLLIVHLLIVHLLIVRLLSHAPRISGRIWSAIA